MVRFYAFPVIFIETALSKSTLIKRAGVRTPWTMGVDHRVDRGTCPPYILKYGGRNVLSPLLFRGTNPYDVVDLLNNDCFSSSNKHNNTR